MPRIQVNDKLSSRDRQHINLLVCPNRGILKFEGRSIPPALKVVNESYKKDGKWSHTTWDCEVAEGYLLLPYSQDFANGRYFGGRTWSVAVNELRTALNLGIHPHIGITDEMIVDAIRVYFRKDADALDSLDTAYTTAGAKWLSCSKLGAYWPKPKQKKPSAWLSSSSSPKLSSCSRKRK